MGGLTQDSQEHLRKAFGARLIELSDNDAALYVAKRAGRNRVELLVPEDGSPLAEVEAAMRSSLRKPFAPLTGPRPVKLRA